MTDINQIIRKNRVAIKVDWQQLVMNFRRNIKISLSKFSESLGLSKGYLSRVLNGTMTPGFEIGIMLLNLHLDMCGEDQHRALGIFSF
jgi:hypothetical protein